MKRPAKGWPSLCLEFSEETEALAPGPSGTVRERISFCINSPSLWHLFTALQRNTGYQCFSLHLQFLHPACYLFGLKCRWISPCCSRYRQSTSSSGHFPSILTRSLRPNYSSLPFFFFFSSPRVQVLDLKSGEGWGTLRWEQDLSLESRGPQNRGLHIWVGWNNGPGQPYCAQQAPAGIPRRKEATEL